MALCIMSKCGGGWGYVGLELRMMSTEFPWEEGREERAATNRVCGGFARVRLSPE